MPEPIQQPIPPSFWRAPLRGRGKVLAWVALFGVAILVALLIVQEIRGWTAPVAELALIDLPIALAIVGLIALVVASGRWLCRWRNLRRVLFVVACLVTLIALAYAEENWRGKHQWQSFRRQWEAKGEKFDLIALVPPPVPDAENFALTPLFKSLYDYTQGPTGLVWHDTNGRAHLDGISADLSTVRDSRVGELHLGNVERGTLADLNDWAAFYRGNTNYPQAPTSASPSETVLTALGKFDPELAELRNAVASRPVSRFPIHYEEQPPAIVLLPHLAYVKKLAILTHVRATAELEARRPAEAFEDLKLGLRLADSITNEVFLIDQLVRIAVLSIDLQTVREGLRRHAWTEAQLTELEHYLAGLDLLAEYRLTIRGERALEIANLDFERRQGFRAHPENYLSDEDGASATAPSLNVMPGGWYYQNILNLARLHQEFMLPIVEDSTHRVFPEINEKGDKAVTAMRWGPCTAFAKVLFPAISRSALRFARSQTDVDCARIACAIERCRLANGKLPETLDVLSPRFIATLPNDVFTGKPLHYRVDPKGGYILYSVGWNQTDDGGEIVWLPEHGKETNARPDLAKGDWVWKMTE